MRTLHVTASRSYEIYIGLPLADCGEAVRSATGCSKAVVVSDSNVAPLYLQTVLNSLHKAGIEAVGTVIPAGEASKCAEQYLQLLNVLVEEELTRSDALVALGGGVVGDLTGFTAATYLRGIAYVQIPTSLLAMVDSSVGGKTAIDLPGGKNLCGAFYQPWAVVCDPTVLDTLPADYYADGSAEVIKYGLLSDPELLTLLAKGEREDLIYRCCAIKRDIVQQDEHDNGVRQLLNLGHTVGHAFEQHSNFALSHGRAVAAGMAVVTRAAIACGDCDAAVLPSLMDALKASGLPTEATAPLSELAALLRADKKRKGSAITLVVPEKMGRCVLKKIPIDGLEDYLRPGF